jgi:hypothetical protein
MGPTWLERSPVMQGAALLASSAAPLGSKPDVHWPAGRVPGPSNLVGLFRLVYMNRIRIFTKHVTARERDDSQAARPECERRRPGLDG